MKDIDMSGRRPYTKAQEPGSPTHADHEPAKDRLLDVEAISRRGYVQNCSAPCGTSDDDDHMRDWLGEGSTKFGGEMPGVVTGFAPATSIVPTVDSPKVWSSSGARSLTACRRRV